MKAGLSDYKPGNILVVPFDESRTEFKFHKPRNYRQYNYLCVFVRYNHGNAVVRLLEENKEEVPIYETVKIAESIESIPDDYNAFL
jgi:hypothetical protein